MGNQRWTIDRFLPLYLEASEKGVTKEDFAESVGLKPDTVYQRVYALRRKGMDIPLLRSKGKIPMLEQADKILAEYRAKKGPGKEGPAKEVLKRDKPEQADPNAELNADSVENIESLLGLN
jgi:hypothetical protein